MALVRFPGAAAPTPDEPETDDGAGAKMSFLEHLDELRKRLIYAVISIAVGCGIAFLFINRIVAFIMEPLAHMLPKGNQLIATSGPDFFMLYLQIGLIAGIFISSPLVLWQVWKFVAPGLYSHEKKFAIPFVLMATVFFLAGGLFSHYVAFPWTWHFFILFTKADYVVFLPKIDDAFSLYSKMLLGFGIVFEIPTLVFFLARMGVVTAGFLLKYFKYAILVIAIVAAVVSPGTDLMSMLIMAVPMLGLYVLSIV
ncbi:MAG: twin-arginine translocase subunit TatC, partial [Vicinamibacterales bacterium]